MPFFPDHPPLPPRNRAKSKDDRDCERQCNSLLVPGFKEKFGKSSDPDIKKGREDCFCSTVCKMQ